MVGWVGPLLHVSDLHFSCQVSGARRIDYRERLILSMVGWVAPLVCEVDRNDRSLVEPRLIHCEMSVILICTDTIDTLYIECYALPVCNIAQHV